MIEVNLLPEDRRPVERTPLPRFLVILGGVIGFCIEGVFLGYLAMLIPQKQGEQEGLKLRKAAIEKTLRTIASIKKDIQVIKQRHSDIDKLTNDRRLWGPILYRLCDPKVLPLSRFWSRSPGTKLKLTLSRNDKSFQTTVELQDILPVSK